MPKDALSSCKLSYLNFLFLLCRGLRLGEGSPGRAQHHAGLSPRSLQLGESPQHRKCLNGRLTVRDASTLGWEEGVSV